MPTVFGDESYASHNGVGIYAIGLVLIPNAEIESARDIARSLRDPGQASIHFHDIKATRRGTLIDQVASGPWSASVWVARSNPRQQERARRILLMHASFGRPSETWILESRNKTQDRHDLRLFASVFTDGKRNPVQLRHSPSSEEPLLWIADVVASATATRIARGLDAPFRTQVCAL